MEAVIAGLLTDRQADALLVTSLPDIRWATGFSGSHAVWLARPDTWHFLTDGRYKEQARREVRGAIVNVPPGDLFEYLAGEDLLRDARRVLFQAEHVSVAQLAAWKELFPHVEWVGAEQLLTSYRASKTREEVARIRGAQEITEAVFAYLLDILRPGLSEREVAAEIVYQHLKRGAERMAFDPIVASGPHGALPHARPGQRELQAGDVLVIDMGCVVDGYASDMTRCVAIGEPGEEARKVYELVLDAQCRAIETAHAGMKTNELDAVARDVIEDAGYGAYFTHSLGHGIGIETHEWPRVSRHTEDTLLEGTVITIEPGVYIPDAFGVRIEDIVVLRGDGCDNLTRSPKALLVL